MHKLKYKSDDGLIDCTIKCMKFQQGLNTFINTTQETLCEKVIEKYGNLSLLLEELILCNKTNEIFR